MRARTLLRLVIRVFVRAGLAMVTTALVALTLVLAERVESDKDNSGLDVISVIAVLRIFLVLNGGDGCLLLLSVSQSVSQLKMFFFVGDPVGWRSSRRPLSPKV